MSGPTRILYGSHNVGKLLAWGVDGMDDNTIQQALRTARMPFVEGHVALMPDAHFGFGSTVGSVFATRGAIIPSAIGVDIGCGMIAAKLAIMADQLPDDLSTMHANIAREVPAGVGKGHSFESEDIRYMPSTLDMSTELTDLQVRKAYSQFGTLGSGNHFVEVCLDESDGVWVVLHSGSRGIGNELAKVHIEGAKGLMKRYFIELEDPDLAYLAEGTPEFEMYIQDMLWAQRYAYGNRLAMHERVVIATLKSVPGYLGANPNEHIIAGSLVNCHHNYTERENQFGKNVWVTRKGAIRARKGDLGIIPGSMGTETYIVEGLGNKASLTSASHGAGRKMSRSKARKELTTESLIERMGDRAWNGSKKLSNATELVDEHPDAYKDINAVMDAQSDLVQVKHRLTQVLNYKGT